MAITPNAQSPAMEAANSQAHSGSLADVLDVILDKGLVIDAFVRVSLVGIEILTLDARIVVASVDTYMHFAREAHRLQMGGGQGSAKQGLAGMMGKLEEGGAHTMARGALKGAGEGLKEGLLPNRQESQGRRGVVQRAVGAIRDALTPDGEDQGQAQAQDRAPEDGSGGSEPASPRSRGRTRESAQPGGRESRGGGAGRRTTPGSRRAPRRDRPAS